MPRIDGLPAAGTLTGKELLPGMQGGATVSLTIDQLVALVAARLDPEPDYSPTNAVLGHAVVGMMVLGRRF